MKIIAKLVDFWQRVLQPMGNVENVFEVRDFSQSASTACVLNEADMPHYCVTAFLWYVQHFP